MSKRFTERRLTDIKIIHFRVKCKGEYPWNKINNNPHNKPNLLQWLRHL